MAEGLHLLQEIVGKEQFYKTMVNTEKKLRIMEHNPKTCVDAGEFADEYEQASLQEPGQEKTLTQDPRNKLTYAVVPLLNCGVRWKNVAKGLRLHNSQEKTGGEQLTATIAEK